MPIVNSTWRLSCNEQTGRFTLHVEYESDDPGEDHQKAHLKIVQKARELFYEYGLTDDQIESERVNSECTRPSAKERNLGPPQIPRMEKQ
jgi:hypothetical protein